tara:strand:- start:2019 stop:3998 length:1980 start_codon:yes stop_codon:yes gene_type:complete
MDTFAQNYDFGKVSKEELQEQYNPLDSSASAAYLYKHRKSFFEYAQGQGFRLITEIHERIKIYNQEGFNYATQQVSLYKSGSSREEVTNIKGYTYNLIGKKIEETKLKKDGIFRTEQSEYFDQTKFTMPNVKVGSVVEYKYRIQSPYASNVDEFVFQHDIPIKKLYAKFEAPEYYSFKATTKGYLSVIPKNESVGDKITFTEKFRSGGNGFNDAGNRTSYNNTDVKFSKKVTTYDLNNIPALKEEPYVNNINNYRSSVKYELSFTKFPNSNIEYVSTTWEDVVKTIYDSSNFGDQLDKTGYYEDEVDAIISNISDPMKRAVLIFNFVKSQVKWNGYYGKYTNDGVKKAFKDRVGNSAEINLMLTSMLRYAGLKAYPVLVSTRENGIPLFPTREGYNYVVSYIKFPEGSILLDATNKYSVPNVLPFRTLNWQGRIIAEQGGSTLIDLYPKEKSENIISMMLSLNENGDIEGSYRNIKTNHRALSFREEYIGVDEDDFLEKLENKYGGLEISDYTVKNEYDLSEPVQESYKFVKENQADIIGDKLYFSPMFFLSTDENPFKLDKREYPVDFGYPSGVNFRVIVNLPEGYKIESLPEPEAFMMPDNLGLFKYNITGNDKMIQLSVESEMNQSVITPLYYDALKAYFSQLVEKENEQIVLTRI